MISLRLTSPPSASLSLKPSYLSSIRPTCNRYNKLKKLQQRRLRNGKCKAELATDAPVAMAIGASILNSLIFPATPSQEDVEAESLIDSADARFAVMGIISFIPYFNWMSWVFAWLDTGKQRYAVYAIIYLAPYVRSNLSISPEESWLPIASILLCIFHIQLEASIQNGDIQRFQIFDEAAKLLLSVKKNDKTSEEREERKDFHNLPSAHQHYRNEIRQEHHEILSDDDEDNRVLCSVYKVGDLNGWGIPSSSNPKVYTYWANYHNLTVGDSLFFLYPPSQDSVIQVTKQSYDTCNLKDPILYMNNGNSLFNITKPGNYYFTSAVDGHCGKSQKLHISVYGNGTFVDDEPASGPAASAPSYPTVFGSIPVQAASDSASPSLQIPVFMAAAAAILLPLILM